MGEREGDRRIRIKGGMSGEGDEITRNNESFQRENEQ